MPAQVTRGFAALEFERRLERAQSALRHAALDGLVVTTPPNMRYFSGFATQFWESPTRPWFLIIPRDGPPVAVIPEIGAAGMAMTWVDDIRTWPSPQPADDGLSLVAAVLKNLPRQFGRIGWEMGRESIIRMPISDFDRLREQVSGIEFVDGSPVIWQLRSVKSAAEIDRLRWICGTASDAYSALEGELELGDSEQDASRKMRLELTLRDVDSVPFLTVVSGAGGYSQIIVGPTDRRPSNGDIMFMDLGATFDGYFCDFDRNFAFGQPSDQARHAHEQLWQATEAGIAAARPGATTTDLFHAMSKFLEPISIGPLSVGRLGHGLGMQLTEPPSNTPDDGTPLVAGMVMTIEPGVEYAPGKMLVHEENIAITEDGCELLTRRAAREMPVI